MFLCTILISGNVCTRTTLDLKLYLPENVFLNYFVEGPDEANLETTIEMTLAPTAQPIGRFC